MAEPKPVKMKPPWADLAPEVEGADQPTMLEPEYASTYSAYAAAPGPKTAGPLLTAIQPVLSEAVRSYAGTEAASPTVMANAKSMALEAARRYDPNRAKLRTHLLSHLRGLRRQVNRSASPIYVPEQWRIDAQRMGPATEELRESLGREPSMAELADHTGIGLDRVRKARSVPGVMTTGQTGESAAPSARSPEAWNTWVEAVYHDLSPVDQIVLESSFGLHGQPTLSGVEVAKKVNLSPGAVAQRKARIQQHLDQFETFLGGES